MPSLVEFSPVVLKKILLGKCISTTCILLLSPLGKGILSMYFHYFVITSPSKVVGPSFVQI